MLIAQTPNIPVLSVEASEIISCPAVTTFMVMGNENDMKEVANLQSALKNIEKLDVDVNGTFDQKTEAAVEAFQRKYSDEVLAPWGATKPSGIVNITTAKKINQIACEKPLTMNQSELDIINAYKARAAGGDGMSASVADAMQGAQPVSDTDEMQPVMLVTDAKPVFDGTSLAHRFGRYFKAFFSR